MPHVRYTTLLRDPISQTLSWEAMSVSQDYYHKYPKKECEEPRFATIITNRHLGTLQHWLKLIENCVDNPFRRNVTMMLVAHAVGQFKEPVKDHLGFPGMSVALSAQWVMGGTIPYSRMTGARVIKYLKENYFLVGVTEYLDEFLVLLALHVGWDPASLYYVYCKPTTTDVHRAEFAHFFPDLMPKLLRSTAPVQEAYEWAKKDFEQHVDRLGPWFKALVRKFKTGLKEYQNQKRDEARPYQWKIHFYKDHHTEDC
jgi:hypothetical protein